MSYGIVRVAKMGAGSVKGIEIHDRREKDGISHTNQDIDWSRSKDNYDLHLAQNENFNRAVKERISQLKLPRAVRKDAVVMGQVLVTSDHSFFEGLSQEQQRQFFQDSYKFLADRYGKENVVSAIVHLDERTPHMHFNFVPVTEDGRLTAKDVLTRERLIDQQDRFQALVGKKHGLNRGERGGKKQHLDVISYKVATRAQEVDKLQSVNKHLNQEKDALQGKIAALQSRLSNCTEFIARIDQIPKGKKTLLGKVEFTAEEANALIKTAETVYSARSTATRAVEDAERMKGTVQQLKSRPLERQVGELQQQNRELKYNLETVQNRLRQFDKALEKSPELQDLFTDVLKSLERGRGLTRGIDR